jgi:RHS repeat-associated protein
MRNPAVAAAPELEQEALARIEAWEAAVSSGRQVSAEDGLVSEVREGGALSRYTWLANGELASITEPDGTRWGYGYGPDGRLLTVTRDDQPWAGYRYDEAGRLLEVSRPDGSRHHVYDAQGRLLRTLRGDAGAFVYRYDERGRVTLARGDQEETRFAHDERGRITRLEQVVEGRALTVEQDFDSQGRLERLRFSPWGVSLTYAWDERGRPHTLAWGGELLARFGYADEEKRSWRETADGLREETWHDPRDGRPVRRRLSRGADVLWRKELVYGAGFRLEKDGERTYRYDELGRLVEAEEGARRWRFQYDAMDELVAEEGSGARPLELELDNGGRVRRVRRAAAERVYRYNQAGEALTLLENGHRLAQCVYDHKGRLVLKRTAEGAERYLYGPDDALLAITDAEGAPRWLFLRLPTGLVGAIDFRARPEGEPVFFHGDGHGNLVFAGAMDGTVEGPFSCDPFGVPLELPSRLPYLHRERVYHAELGLYWIGCRWYDPALRRFLTEDSYTGAPDDERLVNPFCLAQHQRMTRTQILGEWLKQPRVRNRHSWCCNDPVNRFDPNGHWSFGGVLLSILGAIWTLPNTLFGLAVEITCLVGEVVRWLVWLFSFGNVSWQTPGIDVASSGRLNAFALVFTGGWIGSFESLLGITFGNVFFVNKEWKNNEFYESLPDQVAPPAYNGTVTIPKEDTLYEHELRHVNQYAWFGPFFHLGLPLFGVYEWDVIFNGYYDAWLEKNARDYSGF